MFYLIKNDLFYYFKMFHAKLFPYSIVKWNTLLTLIFLINKVNFVSKVSKLIVKIFQGSMVAEVK